jgi:hypothetical protein
VDPSTPQGGSPSKKRLANIPKQVVEKASKSLRKHISPNDDDDEIKNELTYVWLKVKGALEQDPKLKENLASEEDFGDNVARKGEKTFIDSLRAMAANSDILVQGSRAWDNLFEDGTSFSLVPNILIEFFIYCRCLFEETAGARC